MSERDSKIRQEFEAYLQTLGWKKPLFQRSADDYSLGGMTRDWKMWQTAYVAGRSAGLEERDALREFKKRVDIAFTAGILGLSGEVGFRIPCHQFVTSMQVAFRQAEDEYMEQFGAKASREMPLPEPPATKTEPE